MLLSLCAGLIVPRAAQAQPPGKVFHIGYLSTRSATEADEAWANAFRHGLRELGYVEGQNVASEYRWAEGRDERLPALAADLVRLKMDVIVAGNNSAAQAAQRATRTIPIVMAIVTDPVGLGLVASLSRPGGNITGLSSQAGTRPANGCNSSRKRFQTSLA